MGPKESKRHDWRPVLCGVVFLVTTLLETSLASDVAVDADGLAVVVGGIGRLHAEWLRERCTSPDSVDQVTLQRLQGPHEYAPPRILSASLDDVDNLDDDGERQNASSSSAAAALSGLLRVTFTDAHASVFDVAELRAHALEEARSSGGEAGRKKPFIQFQEAARPETLLWRANLTSPSIVQFDDLHEKPFSRLRLYALLQSVGVALVRGAPRRERVCSELAANLSTLRVTEWGENFNVISETSSAPGVKRDLAYTPKAIGMHTDNPYRYPTPDFQLLHVIEQCECEHFPCAECSVRNFFADGFAIAQRMADESPELFDALATVPVRFENNGGDGSSALWHVAPHFELKPECLSPAVVESAKSHRESGARHHHHRQRGARCLKAVRFSSKSGGYAPPLSAEELEVFYQAKRRFSELAHDPAMVIELQLRKGDVVVFDNTRLLHARSAIQPEDGYRFVQGCYLDRDGVQYHWERARRAVLVNAETPTWTSLESATREDFEKMGIEYATHVDTTDELLGLLDSQANKFLGQPVDLREHGLQTASRAYRAGESDDLVVAGLLHDVTEHVAPKGHGEAAAALLAPYVDPATHWLLTHHEVFQGYYYFHHFPGGDRHKRDALRDSPHFNLTERWCQDYDQAAFDPLYPSLPRDFFKPILTRVLNRPAYWWDPTHLKRDAVTPRAA